MTRLFVAWALVSILAATACAQLPDVATVAAEMRKQPTGWPRVDAASLSGKAPPVERLRGLYTAIEKLEHEKQPIDHAREPDRIRNYLAIAKTLRRSGGYGNHVVADAALRLSVFRLGRWLMEKPGAISTINRLIDETEEAALTRGQLATLLPPSPENKAHIAAIIGSDAKVPAGDEAFAVISQVYPAQGQRDASTRALLNSPDMPSLAWRVRITERTLAGVLPALRDLVAAGSDLSKPLDMAEFGKAFPRRAVMVERLGRPGKPEVIHHSEIEDFRAELQDWPAAPVPFYYAAIDFPPRGDGKHAVQITERSLGRVPEDPLPPVIFSPDHKHWAAISPRVSASPAITVDGRRHSGPWVGRMLEPRFTSDGMLVAVANKAPDQAYFIYGSRQVGPFEKPLYAPDDSGRHLFLSRDGKHAAIAMFKQKQVTLFRDGVQVAPPGNIGRHDFAADGSLAYCVHENGAAVVVHGQKRYPIPVPAVTRLKFSPDGKRIGVLTNKQLFIVGDDPKTYDHHQHDFDWTPDSKHVVSWDKATAVVVDGQIIHQDRSRGDAPAYAADGRILAYDRVMKPDGTVLLELSRQTLHRVHFSPDGDIRVRLVEADGDRKDLVFNHPRLGEFTIADCSNYAADVLPGGHFIVQPHRKPSAWRTNRNVSELWIDGKFEDLSNNIPAVATNAAGTVLAWHVRRAGVWRIRIDGVESDLKYDTLSDQPPAVADDGIVRTMGVRDGEVFSIEARKVPR